MSSELPITSARLGLKKLAISRILNSAHVSRNEAIW
jgi:hypothetical protein